MRVDCLHIIVWTNSTGGCACLFRLAPFVCIVSVVSHMLLSSEPRIFCHVHETNFASLL